MVIINETNCLFVLSLLKIWKQLVINTNKTLLIFKVCGKQQTAELLLGLWLIQKF